MFKLQAYNPITGTVLKYDWTLEGFQSFEEACKMIEILHNEGFEEIQYLEQMSAFEIKTWWETAALVGLTPDSIVEEIQAVRHRNRPYLLPVDETHAATPVPYVLCG